MKLAIDIPDELIPVFRQAFGPDVSRAAVEQLAIEGYRSGRLSRYHVQLLLGFDNRWTTERWLGERGLNVQYSTQDLQADRDTIERLFGPRQS